MPAQGDGSGSSSSAVGAPLVVVARRAALHGACGGDPAVGAGAGAGEGGLEEGLSGPVVIECGDDGNIREVRFVDPPTDDGFAAAAARATASPTPAVVTDLALPGFVDIHTHGRAGPPSADMADFWLDPSATTRTLPSMATTSLLASLVFCCGSASEVAERAARTTGALAAALGRTGDGAVVEGVHAEGPVVADLGGLPDSGHQRMSVDRFAELLDTLMGCGLRVMTIAPSVDAVDGYARTRMLLERGVLPALGHDRGCSEADVLGALRVASEFGVQLHVTHLFNVCGWHHRNPSLCNFGMVPRFPALPAYQDLTPPTVEIICDLAHLHPVTVQSVLAARGPDDVACITDSVMVPTPGLKRTYTGRTLVVPPSARGVYLEGTTTLAGSCCSLLDVFHTLLATFGVRVADAARMLATTPARVAGLGHVGAIEPGRRADFACFDGRASGGGGGGGGLEHKVTVVAGVVVHKTGSDEAATAQ